MIGMLTALLPLLLTIVSALPTDAQAPAPGKPSVYLVGSIHNMHFNDAFHYSIPDLGKQVLALRPDLVCGEITPEAYRQPFEGYFPPEAAFLDETARASGVRFAPVDWRMDSARQAEADAAEPSSVKEKTKAQADLMGAQIKAFSGESLYDYLHSAESLRLLDVMYEEIKGDGTVSDIAAGSWHERNRRMATNCLTAAGSARRIVVVAGVDHVPQLRRQFRALGIEAEVPVRRFVPAGQGTIPPPVVTRWQRNRDNLRAILAEELPATADQLLKVKQSRRVADLEEAIRLSTRAATTR